jgi:hypothetical protein
MRMHAEVAYDRICPPAVLISGDRLDLRIRRRLPGALGVAIVSGFGLALGGPDWWHYNLLGHFFNSLHLWSVELFMALLVIHLWGKFWMAAWRGRRTLTWITGVVAFAASVIECFTGYLSQQSERLLAAVAALPRKNAGGLRATGER